MAKKTIELMGRTFEVEKPIDNVRSMTGRYNRDEIYNVYDRPSDSKVSIWHNWCDWVDKMINQNYDVSIEISSHTCMFFSISGTIDFNNGLKAEIWITYAHNRIYFEKEQ